MRMQDNPDAERSLRELSQCGLLSNAEMAAARALGADSALAACLQRAETLHLHIKVDDTAALPGDAFLLCGAELDHGKDGFVKYRFPGGINAIFSHIAVSADDLAECAATRRPRPFLDHIGIDMRGTDAATRVAFEALPAVAEARAWEHVAQGGEGRAVYCCHVEVAAKHWLFPLDSACRPGIPLEFAYGPLKMNAASSGCDLRPARPREGVAVQSSCCPAR